MKQEAIKIICFVQFLLNRLQCLNIFLKNLKSWSVRMTSYLFFDFDDCPSFFEQALMFLCIISGPQFLQHFRCAKSFSTEILDFVSEFIFVYSCLKSTRMKIFLQTLTRRFLFISPLKFPDSAMYDWNIALLAYWAYFHQNLPSLLLLLNCDLEDSGSGVGFGALIVFICPVWKHVLVVCVLWSEDKIGMRATSPCGRMWCGNLGLFVSNSQPSAALCRAYVANNVPTSTWSIVTRCIPNMNVPAL